MAYFYALAAQPGPWEDYERLLGYGVEDGYEKKVFSGHSGQVQGRSRQQVENWLAALT
jgi:hypothetical protein